MAKHSASSDSSRTTLEALKPAQMLQRSLPRVLNSLRNRGDVVTQGAHGEAHAPLGEVGERRDAGRGFEAAGFAMHGLQRGRAAGVAAPRGADAITTASTTVAPLHRCYCLPRNSSEVGEKQFDNANINGLNG